MLTKIVIWIIIILIIMFIIRLLRKWIRRLILILILLVLAFFIYGIFSPSGAARLWYNVRTFPDRIMSWVSNKSFLNYDNYKLNLPSTKIDDVVDKIDNIKIDDIKVDKDDTEKDKEEKKEDKKENEKANKVENEETIESTGKSFASLPPIKFFDIKLKDPSKSESENEFVGYNEFAGYSDSNLLGLMSQYIEKNLGDNNEILVTVEYDDLDQINRIILKSREKGGEKVSGSFEVYYDKDSHSFFTSNSDSSKDVTIKDVAIIDNISQTNVKNDEKKEEIEPVKNNNSTNESEKTGKEEAEELYLSLF